jgi:hypothetical protein
VDGDQPLLSVIVPVYNEEHTVDTLLRRLATGPYPYPQKEVVVVDDGSRDDTPRILERWSTETGFRVVRHAANRGKGAAVRSALPHVRGIITVIQDADLEYDPADLPQLVEMIQRSRHCAVYGSRYAAAEQSLPWTIFRLGVSLFNGMIWLLYGRRLTDEATCYKMLRTGLLLDLGLEAERFEFCAELTAKLCRLGVPIVEIPITYRPRTRTQGKKIGWTDAWHTAWTLVKWRFLPLARAPVAKADSLTRSCALNVQADRGCHFSLRAGANAVAAVSIAPAGTDLSQPLVLPMAGSGSRSRV